MTTHTSPPADAAAGALAADHLFDVAIDFEPMQLQPSPLGTRIVAVVRSGVATGPRFAGRVLPGGGDWLIVGSDGVARLDIRATLQADDGALVNLTGAGRIWMEDPARERFLAGDAVQGDELQAWTVPVFETGAESHAWLNRSVAVGRVTELGLDRISYQLYALR
ncbi:MAG TPA: DUF3237 domain-containing protein [Acidimicrobiales bacterium]